MITDNKNFNTGQQNLKEPQSIFDKNCLNIKKTCRLKIIHL